MQIHEVKMGMVYVWGIRIWVTSDTSETLFLSSFYWGRQSGILQIGNGNTLD